MTTTRVSVEVRDGRHQVRTSAGLLRAQRLHGPADRARVAVVGQTALLLGDDQVGLDIEVGPGAWLELSDIAGTVAYHGRGRPASWHTSLRLGLGARLRYAGEPLILSDGSDVTRTLTVDLADGAVALLRETLVFGRAGEVGGTVDVRDSAPARGRRVLSRAPGARSGGPLAAGGAGRGAGRRLGAHPGRIGGRGWAAQQELGWARCGPEVTGRQSDLVTYQLLDPGSTLTRYLGTSLADSPLAHSSLGALG